MARAKKATVNRKERTTGKRKMTETDVLEISNEDLAEILLSEKFMKALRQSGNITRRTQNETAFTVAYGLEEHKIYTPQIVEGTHIGMRRADDGPDLDFVSESSLMIVNHHFHPDSTGPVIPSSSDLTLVEIGRYGWIDSLPKDKAVCIRPLYSVGKIRTDLSIDVLIFQEQRNLFDNEIELAGNALHIYLQNQGITPDEDSIKQSSIPTSEIFPVLNSHRYNACTLNFPKTISSKQGRAEYREKSYESFSQTLKPFSQKLPVVDKNIIPDF